MLNNSMIQIIFLVVAIVCLIGPFIIYTTYKKREWKLIHVGDDIFYQRLTENEYLEPDKVYTVERDYNYSVKYIITKKGYKFYFLDFLMDKFILSNND